MTYSTINSSPKVIADPQFAVQPRDVDDFLSEFGPHNNRYIPRFPSDWASQLRQRAEELTPKDPVKRQALLERIRREASLCTVPVGWKWDGECTWRSNVQKGVPNYSSRLVVGHGVEPEPFLPWAKALEAIRETRQRSWRFRGSIADYLESCLPLLLNSPACYLIDPYLDVFSEDGEMLLRSLYDRAKGSQCYSIQVITRRSIRKPVIPKKDPPQMTDQEVIDMLKRTYKGILPKDREIQLHLVTEAKSGAHGLRLHDRFFLTKHGAISFGHGFLVAKQPQPQQNAFAVDRDHHLALKQTYIDGVARFSERLPKVSGIPYPKHVYSFSCKSSA